MQLSHQVLVLGPFLSRTAIFLKNLSLSLTFNYYYFFLFVNFSVEFNYGCLADKNYNKKEKKKKEKKPSIHILHILYYTQGLLNSWLGNSGRQ